jgi:hypothetical protein
MTLTGQEVLDLFQKSLDSFSPRTKKRVITEREADILRKLYDFEEYSFPTLAEVASLYNLTRERIRQIHNKSLKKLGITGKKAKEDMPCVLLLQLLVSSIENSSAANEYLKAGYFWKENLSDFPGRIVMRLLTNLLYTNKNDFDFYLTTFTAWRHFEFEQEKQIKLDEFRKLKETGKIIKLQDDILSKVIWFEKRTKWPDLKRSDLLPKRKVSDDPRYKSGIYYSDKCERKIQYESGLESDFILKLENFPKVKFYVEQPETIKYTRNDKEYIYTPDFAVFLESSEVFFVEIKDFVGMVDGRVQRNLEALIDYCSARGFGLLLLEKTESINHMLGYEFNEQLRNEFRLRLNENEGRTIFIKEFKAIQETYNFKWIEFLRIVVSENWSFYQFPFKLTNRNPYQKFRETFCQFN